MTGSRGARSLLLVNTFTYTADAYASGIGPYKTRGALIATQASSQAEEA